MQAVDLTFDALINEVDVSKMRVFLSDVLFGREKTGDKAISIPFGKQDCTVFRKVMSTEDTIQEFAPALRTSSQSEAFRIALQMLGDLCGFGLGYFDFDETRGYVRTATEVSSDNSALMRNIRRHENALQEPIIAITRAVMAVSRGFGESIPDEGAVSVMYDDSIIQDVAAEKAQDMAEVGVTMAAWEYRAKWYGERREDGPISCQGHRQGGRWRVDCHHELMEGGVAWRLHPSTWNTCSTCWRACRRSRRAR